MGEFYKKLDFQSEPFFFSLGQFILYAIDDKENILYHSTGIVTA